MKKTKEFKALDTLLSYLEEYIEWEMQDQFDENEIDEKIEDVANARNTLMEALNIKVGKQ